jgi:hypothetical protein
LSCATTPCGTCVVSCSCPGTCIMATCP